MRNHYIENKQLLTRIRTGDYRARQTLIEDNIGLVYATAGRLLDGYTGLARHHRRQELVERGYEGLCAGAARVETLPHDNVGSYLGKWIRGAMLRPDTPLVRNLPKEARVWQSFDHELDRRADPTVIFTAEDEKDAADALSLIFFLCADTADVEIVKLRMDGLSKPDVARKLGLPMRQVNRRLDRLATEFFRLRRRGMSNQV